MLGKAFVEIGRFTDIDFGGVLYAGEDVDVVYFFHRVLLRRVFICRGYAGTSTSRC